MSEIKAGARVKAYRSHRSASKYKPHIGAKEEIRAQDRAYMEEAFPTRRGMRGTQPIGIAYHRSAPILCQARRGKIVRAPY